MKKNSTKKKTRKDFSSIRFWIVGGDGNEPPTKTAKVSRYASHLLPPADEGAGYEGPRVRATKLRMRMLKFGTIYNAAWYLRNAEHGSPDVKKEKVARLCDVLSRELQNCRDQEALLYAFADALTAYPRGLPWES